MNRELLQLLVYGRTCPEIILREEFSEKYTLKKGKKTYLLSHYTLVEKEEGEYEYKLLRESPVTVDVAMKLLS